MRFWVWICPGSKWKKPLEEENYLCFPYLFIFNTLKPTFYWHEEEPWQTINTSSLFSCVKIMILSFLIIHSHINHEALLPCPLSLLFFIHLLPFPFPSFPSCLTALLILLPNDSRFALVTAPPTLPPHLPTRDTAQVQPRLSQCASLRMQ